MAQLPSALACHASRPSRSDVPLDWTAKSMIVVVPPNAAARVPRLERVLGEGAAERQLHVGVDVDAAGDDVLAGRVDGAVDAAATDAARSVPMAAMVSPSTRTSARWEPSALTTVPLTMSVRIGPSSRRRYMLPGVNGPMKCQRT